MSLVLLCCQSTTSTQIQSITLPSQAERWQPLFRQHVCCAPHHNLNTHTAVGRTHKPHMLTHIRTNMCTYPKVHTHTHSTATVVGCCLLHAFLILSLSLIPSHPSSPAWVCAVWHWQMLPSPSAPLKETLVYFPFLHPQACVVVFFGCFHPFMPMKIGPVEWMEMVLFHSSKRRNAIRCENNSRRWGNTWLHSLPTSR